MPHVWDVLRKMAWAVAGVGLLSACRPGVPSRLIQPDRLEEILYDYHMAQAMAESNTADSLAFRRYSYVSAVFRKHGVTEAEFDSTMIWYSAHANYLNDIYKRLHERYSAEVALLGAVTGKTDHFAGLDAQGDTANIWPEHSFRVLKPRPLQDRLSFTLAADTTFRRGDVLLWRFDPRYVFPRGGKNEAYVGLYVEYDNDSTAGITRRIYSGNRVEIRAGGDSLHDIRAVGGFVYYKPTNAEGNYLLVLQDMMLVRMHRRPAPADSVAAQPAGMPADSLAVLPADSLRPVPGGDTLRRRLSPDELRESRPVEHTIEVVKEKPYRSNRQGGRTRRQGTAGNRAENGRE